MNDVTQLNNGAICDDGVKTVARAGGNTGRGIGAEIGLLQGEMRGEHVLPPAEPVPGMPAGIPEDVRNNAAHRQRLHHGVASRPHRRSAACQRRQMVCR